MELVESRRALGFFAECPWGTEPFVAAEIETCAPGPVAFGQWRPHASVSEVLAEPESLVAPSSSTPTHLQSAANAMAPTRGVVPFAIDASQLSDDALKTFVHGVVHLRSIDNLNLFLGCDTTCTSTQAAAACAARALPLLNWGVDFVTHALGLRAPYKAPASVDRKLVQRIREYGGDDPIQRAAQPQGDRVADDEANRVARVLADATETAELVSTQETLERVVFRVRAERLNKRCKSFSSQELASAIAEPIGDAHPEWPVSMNFFNIEVYALHDTASLNLGLRVHAPNLPRGHNYTLADELASEFQRRVLGQALARGSVSVAGIRYCVSYPGHFKHDIRAHKGQNAMHPSLASTLVRLVAPTKDEVVLDPMAGSGTIPLEAFVAHCRSGGDAPLLCIGGDVSRNDVINQGMNFSGQTLKETMAVHDVGSTGQRKSAPYHSLACMAQWDAMKLPLRTATIDIVITDLPFGRRCGNHGVNAKLYPAFMAEVHRILTPMRGRAALLTVERSLMERTLCGTVRKGAEWLAPLNTTLSKRARKAAKQAARTAGTDVGDALEAAHAAKVATLAAAPAVQPAGAQELWDLVRPPFQVDMNGLYPFIFVLKRI